MKAIITFHSIDSSDSVLSFAPEMFSQLLAAFCESGFSIVGLRQLLDGDEDRAVALTFDDGMQSVYRHALPILKEYDAPSSLFLTTGPIGNSDKWPEANGQSLSFPMLDWTEVEALHAAGVRIEGHTGSHPDMRALDASRIAEECNLADDLIEDRLGRRPQFFAYPFGYHNTASRNFARNRYLASVTTELGELGTSYDKAAIPRIDSYYLRSDWLARNLQSTPARTYLKLRSILRNVRGSQCKADSP